MSSLISLVSLTLILLESVEGAVVQYCKVFFSSLQHLNKHKKNGILWPTSTVPCPLWRPYREKEPGGSLIHLPTTSTRTPGVLTTRCLYTEDDLGLTT